MLDALEYEQDVAAAEVTAFDAGLLRQHPAGSAASRLDGLPAPLRPQAEVWVMNSGAPRLLATLKAAERAPVGACGVAELGGLLVGELAGGITAPRPRRPEAVGPVDR